MLELKADGPAELKLLELLLPSGAQVSLTGSSMSAATQQQLDSLNYIVERQQEQLAQAQAAIAVLTGQPPLPLLPPAASTEDSGLGLSETPRRYITGALGQGQSKAITAPAQAIQIFERSPRQFPSILATGSRCLVKPSLFLVLFCLVTWGVFEYIAPPIGNRLLHTTTGAAPAPKKASEQPKSNLDDSTTPPGSAASKAGTQPNALDL